MSTTGFPTAPSSICYRAPSWSARPAPPGCAELVEVGATVYASYFAGTTEAQRGPWFPWLEEIFGVRQRLRYGLVDPIEDDEVVLEFAAPFGGIARGARLAFRVGGIAGFALYLPVDADGAEVLAVDQHGSPALLRRRVGRGQAVLCRRGSVPGWSKDDRGVAHSYAKEFADNGAVSINFDVRRKATHRCIILRLPGRPSRVLGSCKRHVGPMKKV